MLGPVVDLAFSHSTEEVVIGIVDSFGNMFVHRVVEEPSGTSSERIMEITRTGINSMFLSEASNKHQHR